MINMDDITLFMELIQKERADNLKIRYKGNIALLMDKLKSMVTMDDLKSPKVSNMDINDVNGVVKYAIYHN